MKLQSALLLGLCLLVSGCYDSAEMAGGDNYFDSNEKSYDSSMDPELDPDMDADMDADLYPDSDMPGPWGPRRHGYGSLSQAEISLLTRFRFERLDANADGVLSFEEYSPSAEQMFGQPGETRGAPDDERAARPRRPQLED